MNTRALAQRQDQRTASQVTVFATLWALAHLAHLLRKGDPSTPLVWAVLGAAILVLDRPSSHRRLAALAGVQLAYLLHSLPRTDNHLYIVGFVNAGLLATIILGSHGRRSARTGTIEGAFPYIRLVIVISYGTAALAKLNHGFFDPVESCAVDMYHDAIAVLEGRLTIPELPDTAEGTLPWLIAGTELAVPILLMLPVTRLAGVALVVLFHLSISLSPSATALDFTLVLFALVYLYLPDPAGDLAEQRLRALRERVPILSRIPRSAALIALASLAAAMLSQDGFGIATVSGNRNWVLLAAAALPVGALLLDATLQARRHKWPMTARIGVPGIRGTAVGAAYAVGIGLLVLNVASPYLGGKTVTSFTMYSNLQTEDGSTNHFFIPRLRIFSGQDELVLIEESSNRRLQRIASQGRLITWHELRRELADDPGARIRYQLNGMTFAHDEARENPDLVSRDPIGHRFVAHRLYDPERARCLW